MGGLAYFSKINHILLYESQQHDCVVQLTCLQLRPMVHGEKMGLIMKLGFYKLLRSKNLMTSKIRKIFDVKHCVSCSIYSFRSMWGYQLQNSFTVLHLFVKVINKTNKKNHNFSILNVDFVLFLFTGLSFQLLSDV